MKNLKVAGNSVSTRDLFSKLLIPDENRISEGVPYNYFVAKQLISLGFTTIQEMPMPEWGSADIFAYNNEISFVAECKSEKDRDLKRALGQIITYSAQLFEQGYKIDYGFIFTRVEPVIGKEFRSRNQQRIYKDIEFLNSYLPFKIKLVRVSNKTLLTKDKIC